MEEEVIDYLYNWATSDGFKKSKEDFVKLLQTNDEVLSYAFDFAQKDGFKKDKNALGLLVGRTSTAAPVATTEPATTAPIAETKPTVTPEPEKQVATPTVDMAKMPTMEVKSVEPTPTKEEPMTAEKKEIVKSDIESSITTIPEKTEVKAIETPSDKMVVKSKKKEAEKDEWDCPVGETGCAKNETEVQKYVEKINKDNNKNYGYIADREGKLASFIDSKDMLGRTIVDFYKTEDYDHNKKGFMFSAEELPKSKRFSTYNIPIEGKETSLIYDNKTGVIMRQTDDAIKTKDGNQMKTWLDVPMNNPEYEALKAEIGKAKGGNTAPKVSTVPTLEPWQQPQGTKVEEPKVEVKEVPAPSDKMVIKSEAKVEPKPVEEVKVEVKEMKTDEPKMKVKGKLKPEPVKIETIKVESEKGPTTVEVPSFAVPEPRKKYKPYGEKGPDVYYSEEYDQYIIKEGDNRTVVEKGSGKYEEIDKKIGETVKGTTEGTGKCDPDESGDSCSKNTLILSDFINNNYDEYEMGWRATSEGRLIHKLNEDKKSFDENQVSRYVRFSDMELEDQNEKDPEIQEINKRNYEYNQKAGQIWYANDEPPKDKRFVIYKPYGDDRTLIYDKESEVILKQIDKAPEVDFSSTKTIYDTKGKIVQEGSNATEFYKNYKKNNPNKGLNVWYGYHKDRPEYKELKSIIEGVNYKKEKGAKNTYVAPPTETQFVPDWLKK